MQGGLCKIDAMNTFLRGRIATLLVFLITVLGLATGVWRYAYLQGLDQLHARGEADLSLASDRLVGQLQRYRDLAVFLADHPQVHDILSDQTPGRARDFLQDVADKSAALDVRVVDVQGRVLASPQSAPGAVLIDQPFVRRALRGALGWGHGPSLPLTDRAYFHAAPVFGDAGQIKGAVVVSTDLNGIDYDWRGSNPAAFFTDNAGVVQIANRSELLFWQRPQGQPGLIPPDQSAVNFSASFVQGNEIWKMGWGPYIPYEALHLTKSLPVIGLTGEVLLDIAPARRLAVAQASAVAALCLAFGALLFLATERRRALSQANIKLERQVAKRTAALNASNLELRHEAAEREEAQAALRRAQADLVQAGKLSALGQMSAGISHELNQPLMAIRSFAENAVHFIARDKPERAADNLSRISEMAERMARIIQNLRAFARQESMPQKRVDVVRIVASAVELTETYLREVGVTLVYDAPPNAVWVHGGEVRLGQVFVNLITNASDAMAGRATRRLTIQIAEGDSVVVSFQDTGPGIEMPDKVFDPFYTTKSVGSSSGMGLGLSISYGIVQSFGGQIRGSNLETANPDANSLDGGGAMFSVQLERADEVEVAA
ncbi:C4-dicarboxylate transport sensor protein [Roseobacter sp. GAI101]|nr:C4-dicarboxylate transport sensor protein [Roseobacter sp. GAI101]